MKILLHIESEEEMKAVASIHTWLDDCIFYTSTDKGRAACQLAGVKHRIIKDIRILVWEMARWKPKVFVDASFTPGVFPRNGEVTVFQPYDATPPSSKKLLLYDYIFTPSEEYASAINKSGVPLSKLRVVGLPYFDIEPIDDLNKQLIYKPDGNAGLRAATLIHKIGTANNNFQMSLTSESVLGKPM